MPRDDARTIKVRCATWDQVEAFYTVKLKADVLVVKMPISPSVGEGVTVALGLPNGLVFAIDGAVTQVGAKDGQARYPVAMKMHGLTREVRGRLERLVADGRAGLLSSLSALPDAAVDAQAAQAAQAAPAGADAEAEAEEARAVRLDGGPLSPSAQAAFDAMTEYHKLIRTQMTHEILGVSYDADLRTVRAAYFELARRRHPDLVARENAPALTRLASEVFLHINRAYDRLREALVVSSGAKLARPASTGGSAWLVEESDVASGDGKSGNGALSDWSGLEITPPARPALPPRPTMPPPVPPAPPPPAPAAGRAAGSSAGIAGAGSIGLTAVGAAVVAAAPKNLAAELFGDLAGAAPESDSPTDAFDTMVPSSTEQALSVANAGRAALAAHQYEVARGHFAAALRLDQRNRPVRALYHVAAGHVLRARGQDGEAQVQFETALGHDPGCAEAQRALGRAARRA